MPSFSCSHSSENPSCSLLSPLPAPEPVSVFIIKQKKKKNQPLEISITSPTAMTYYTKRERERGGGGRHRPCRTSGRGRGLRRRFPIGWSGRWLCRRLWWPFDLTVSLSSPLKDWVFQEEATGVRKKPRRRYHDKLVRFTNQPKTQDGPSAHTQLASPDPQGMAFWMSMGLLWSLLSNDHVRER